MPPPLPPAYFLGRFFNHSTKPNLGLGSVLAEVVAQRTSSISSFAGSSSSSSSLGGDGGGAAAGRAAAGRAAGAASAGAGAAAGQSDSYGADDLYALRDIKAGTELLEDYNTYGEDPEWYRRLTMERLKWIDEAAVLMQGPVLSSRRFAFLRSFLRSFLLFFFSSKKLRTVLSRFCRSDLADDPDTL